MSEERITLFAEILLPLPIPGTYTYRVPFELNQKVKVGQRAAVQFGATKIMSGLIMSITSEVPDCTSIKYLLIDRSRSACESKLIMAKKSEKTRKKPYYL